ncbi:MAG TPA: tetratricopeptide repeat protein [Longimicrobiales bacterium]|nr:tetratricopeptide repeat protein [Longimicrobiales bacterium]
MLELRILGATDLRAPDGAVAHSVLAQPKRLALLVYLVLAAPGAFVRRDTLLPLFWPEADEARARAALRKAIHYLRQSLGADVLVGRGAEEVGVNPGRIDCDAIELRRGVAAGRPEQAVERYGGELLPGFHVEGVPAFEQWLEAERGALRRLAAAAAVSAAGRALAAGGEAAAADWQRRAHEIAPDDEEILQGALRLLVAAGRRSAAVELHAAHQARLAELGIEADPSLAALVARVEKPAAPPGGEDPPPRAGSGTAAPAPADFEEAPAAPPGSGVAPPAAAPRRVKVWLVPAAAAVAILLLAWLAFPRLSDPAAAEGTAPLLAVGAVTDFTGSADSLALLIPELLATNLSRVPHVRMVANARISELVASEPGAAARSVALANAARRANAHELLEGALYRLPGGELRLDLRRVRLTDGHLLGTYRIVGAELFDVVDRATAELAAAIGAPPGEALRVAEVTTTSLVALRFYREGLDAYFQADASSAARLFEAALAEDSAFAMAAYYAGRSHAPDAQAMIRFLTLADSLAEHTTERERLLIRGTLALYQSSPSLMALADSLATRYPEDPAGHLLLGRALNMAGRFEEALGPLRRAVALDSAALARPDGPCTACDALVTEYESYVFLDSTARAEEAARRLHEARPEAHGFVMPLAHALFANGRYEEADAMVRRAGELGMPAEWVTLSLIGNHIRRGEFTEADAALRSFIATSIRPLRSEARWLLVISLRNQGRLAEALEVVEEERDDPAGGRAFLDATLLLEAAVRFERGDHERAARLYHAIVATVPGEVGEGAWSRHTAWFLTHAANAEVMDADLGALGELTERVRVLGEKSAYGRDQRLHHHIRGLRAARLGRHERAVEAFRAAVYSTASGYTRTNVELAKSLLALGRYAEAVAVLDPPLRNGGIESTLFYATRTEMRALLAEAYAGMGEMRQARAHAEAVLAAWRGADPVFGARVERLRSIIDAGPA